jgi:hypothetical protein
MNTVLFTVTKCIYHLQGQALGSWNTPAYYEKTFFYSHTVLLLLFFAASRFVDLPVEQPGEGNIPRNPGDSNCKPAV